MYFWPPGFLNVLMSRATAGQMSTITRALIHRHCHKIYLTMCLRTIARQKLRYPKMIIRHILRVTDLAIIQDKLCDFT